MSPRPRTVDDDVILLAAARVLGRVGPMRLTLAHVAREVGLAPATLIQRFGSKRKLLLRLARSRAGAAEAQASRLRAASGTPLGRVRAYLAGFAALADSPRVMANHLAALQLDLTDAAFHRSTLALFREHERVLSGLLDEALAAGELAAGDGAALARTLVTVANGSLLLWGIHREGPAADWLAVDVDRVLAPYVRKRGR
jgi:AcrR family transcriptional regulator